MSKLTFVSHELPVLLNLESSEGLDSSYLLLRPTRTLSSLTATSREPLYF